MTNYMIFWKSQNYGNKKKVNCCQGLEQRGRGKGGIGKAQGIFRDTKLFCVIVQ